jgi:Tfp pilus assembly protein PilX
MTTPRNQSGVALVVALLMLTVLALLGVSAVNNSTVNLRVTYNMQSYQDAEAAAQDAIEQVIGTIASFNTPADKTIPSYGGIGVQVDAPVCLRTRPAEGYSAKFPLAPEETEWSVRAVATDGVTGAAATLTQGVAITMPADSCP